MRRAGLVAVAGLLLGAVEAWAQGGCPPGLREAAREQGRTLAEAQRAIRASGLASPAGIEETVQFDLGNHACHRGPGQAYREYGEPRCQPAREDGRVWVDYPYGLFYRKALTLEEMFRKGWTEGSAGILRVTFEAEGARWIPVAKREVLDRGETGPPKPPKGHSGGGRP